MKPKPIILSSDRKESLQTQLQDLPIAYYISNFKDSNYDYVDWHWHDEVQYCLVVKGTILFHVNQETYEIEEGNGIFINSRQIHCSKPIGSTNALYHCFEFSPTLLFHDYNSSIYKSYVMPIVKDSQCSAIVLDQNRPRCLEILNGIRSVRKLLDESQPAFELNLLVEIIKIWKNTFLSPNIQKNTSPVTTRENERLRTIFTIIQTQYSDDLTLEDISKSAHLSRSECSRFFHKCTGQGLFQYLNQYRIHKSLELLINSDLSIADVAYSVGFASQSYYTACFKKEMHMTPKQYQKQYSI
ncbi:transcriptional regulator, AraC family [Lachnospiraceae bacterium KM106-2]|nr:transcriptional regulator, AraC family [Lachnospiraceae bacterium KM106-2]